MMTNESNANAAPNPFGKLSEADRKAALDVFGRFMIEARDTAIIQWHQILDGKREYAPWERVLRKFPEFDERCRDVVRTVIPHIVDTFMYCLLADLDASQSVRVSVTLDSQTVADVARASWGLPAEPTGAQGWLVRFSQQRFEQPY
jgi:hypothetical protein